MTKKIAFGMVFLVEWFPLQKLLKHQTLKRINKVQMPLKIFAMIDESGFINGFNDNNVPSPVPLRSELIHRIQNH